MSDVDLRENHNIVDYLTCGTCDEEFPLANITNFIHHKTVNCDQGNIKVNKNVTETNKDIDGEVPKSLFCSSCLKEFSTARGLLKHVQFQHNINIFVSRFDHTTPSRDLQTTECVSNQNITPQTDQESIISNQTIPEPSCCEKKNISERDESCPCRVSGQCNDESVFPSSNSSSNEKVSQFCLMNQCTDSTTSDEGGTAVCCNKEECCVTIIPVTHEEPLKCCNSLPPKKRKLHLVKHINGRNDKENLNVALCKEKPPVISFDGEKDCYGHDSTGDITPINNVDNQVNEQEFIQAIDVNDVNNGRAMSPSENTTDLRYTPQTHKQSCSSTNHIEDILSSNIVDSDNSNLILDANQTVNNKKHSHNEEKDSAMKKRKYPTTRPYKCDSKGCSKAFNQRVHLKKHMSKHTGVKPFKCDECDYSTVERSHLKVHIRIHTGEKPFNCPYCKYKTAQNSTLKIHLKRRHSEKLFKCNLCSEMFTQKSVLDSHLLKHQNSRISPFQDLQMSLNELNDDTFNSQILVPIPSSTNIIPSIIGGELPLLSPLSNPILPDQPDRIQ